MSKIRNKDSLARASYKYARTPKGIYLFIKGNAKRKSREVMNQSDFLEWYANQPRVCVYCGIGEKEKRHSIDRMDNNVGYIIGNIALACADCNGVKGSILTYEEMKVIGNIIMKKRWQQ